MFITKKKFDAAIKEAREKAFMEADKTRWQAEEMTQIREDIRRNSERLDKIENKGNKRRACPCAVFPKRW